MHSKTDSSCFYVVTRTHLLFFEIQENKTTISVIQLQGAKLCNSLVPAGGGPLYPQEEGFGQENKILDIMRRSWSSYKVDTMRRIRPQYVPDYRQTPAEKNLRKGVLVVVREYELDEKGIRTGRPGTDRVYWWWQHPKVAPRDLTPEKEKEILFRVLKDWMPEREEKYFGLHYSLKMQRAAIQDAKEQKVLCNSGQCDCCQGEEGEGEGDQRGEGDDGRSNENEGDRGESGEGGSEWCNLPWREVTKALSDLGKYMPTRERKCYEMYDLKDQLAAICEAKEQKVLCDSGQCDCDDHDERETADSDEDEYGWGGYDGDQDEGDRDDDDREGGDEEGGNQENGEEAEGDEDY
ncbi:hypothetical protein HK097_001392 [Rhizophlyctis rosea]|uniref:Uncharacterized protein n=1 Tax=Rhizophlyctis rosea TaxID=64517 RepID=A0AAD5WYC6_9FUNG|nr:hypothetical protein HK097_001392 [Rhizophlyctis rosea]